MRAAGLVAIAVAGCSGSAPSRPVTSKSTRTPLAAALAYERGAGVPRDYTKAAQIYDAACSDSRGDLAACGKLLHAITGARGVAFDRTRIARLAAAMCKRHDVLGCTLTVFLHEDALVPQAKAELEHVDFAAECARGATPACEALLAFDFPNFQGSSGVEAKQRDHAELACKAGVLEGCLALIRPLDECAFQAGAERCATKTVAEWTKYEEHARLDALARVRGECDRGDADACATLPGRELPYGELCSAHDYTACSALGCLGDAHAAALAKAQQVDERCQGVVNRDVARHTPPPPTHAVLPPEPEHGKVTPAHLPPFRSLAFRRLGSEADDWSWPSFEATNLGDQKIIRLRYTEYAYDRTGKQLARIVAQGNGMVMLAPGATTTLTPGSPYDRIPDAAVAFDICYDFISFEGATLNAIGGTIDAAGCPEQWVRGSGGAPLDAAGSLAQQRLHAAAKRGVVRYAVTDGSPEGASARALAQLAAHEIALAGSDVKPASPDTLAIPVLVSGLGVIFHVQGVTALRLSPVTLAKIFQRDIKKWNDPAIARDNPGAKLPAEPILVFRDGSWDEKSDRDGDATHVFVAYLARSARGAWRLGEGSAFAWPADVRLAYGLVDIVAMTEGAISFVELSRGHAEQARYAAIANRAGAYVAPTAASLRAAAAAFTDQPGPIDAKARDAYPIAFGSWLVVAAKQTDRARSEPLVGYLRYLVTDGQQLLEGLGLAPLPPAIAAKARELVPR